MEGELSKDVSAKQTADAFLSRAADDVRVYRENAFPAVGREAARALLAAKRGAWTWLPADGGVSRSGELGYTYGAYEFKAADGKTAESGNYLRVWKRRAGGGWKVVLDISYPVPPPAPAS
jgi:ketosteroid isomerase-like protein